MQNALVNVSNGLLELEFWTFLSVDRSIARSLDRSLDRSLARSLDRSLARSIARSSARSIARCLNWSLARSLADEVFRGFEFRNTDTLENYLGGSNSELLANTRFISRVSEYSNCFRESSVVVGFAIWPTIQSLLDWWLFHFHIHLLTPVFVVFVFRFAYWLQTN